jgi:hypothetical protein
MRNVSEKYPRHSSKTKKRSRSHSSWKFLSIQGTPYERGKQHGKALSHELRRVFHVLEFAVAKEFNVSLSTFYHVCKTNISPIVKHEFPEFYEEIKGIVHGAKEKGIHIHIDHLIAWNSYLSMAEYFGNRDTKRCSAFIATGHATLHGDIIMAHNTHCDFVTGSLYNIILYVIPQQGYSFVMQTAPGLIASGVDFFLTSSGIIGCETTISEISYTPKFTHNYPYFCRIRKAMQYGKTLDDYVQIMTTKNAGDYPCSWLFGDINSNEIMLCEIGLTQQNIQRTKHGVYYGINSAIGKQLREKETNDENYQDITNSSGARKKRFEYLLSQKYHGKLTISIAKRILSDHYNEDTKRMEPSNLTICNHFYEETKDSYPWGAQDGKVVNSTLAKEMKFWAIWGSSCGKSFSKTKYIRQNPSMRDWEEYLVDYPKGTWKLFTS